MQTIAILVLLVWIVFLVIRRGLTVPVTSADWPRSPAPPSPPPAEEPKEDWGTNRLYWTVGDEMSIGEPMCLVYPRAKDTLLSWSANALIYESEACPGIPLVWEGRASNYSARDRQRKKERDELEKKVAAESVYEMAKAAEFQKQQGL